MPLMGFESEVDPIRFGSNTEIVRLTPGELRILGAQCANLFLREPDPVDLRVVSKLLASGLAIRVCHQEKLREISSCTDVVDRVLSCMRLVSQGEPAVSVTFTRPLGLAPGGWSLAWGRELVPRVSRPSMSISADLAAEAVRLWPAIERLSTVEDGGLDIAFRKMQDAYQRERHEDRIIDIAILFESTLLHDVQEELRYRLAVRGSVLLREVRDPISSFAEFRRLYDVRSKIVHGGKLLKDILRGTGEKPVEFVDSALGLARDTLRVLLAETAKGDSLSTILDRIDRQIIVGPPSSPTG